jgi:hypothetical protein
MSLADQLSTARSILDRPHGNSSWPDIVDSEEIVFWDTHWTVVQDWTARLGSAAGFADAEEVFVPMAGATQAQRDNCDEDCLISYRGKTVRVPRQRIHADAAIALHTFAFMVRDDTEFRYCIDSDFNNAAAFLALPKASWQALEAEYGTAAVDFRFLAIAPDVDTFLAEVVFNDDPRCHPDDDEGEPGNT